MATKFYGTCTGTTGSKYDLWLEVTQNSQSVENNTSNITVALKLKRNDGYAASAYNLYEAENTVSLSVGGVSRVSGNITIDTRSSATAVLASWTGNIQHNSEGALSAAVSGSFTMSGADLRGGTVSASYKCTDIPRASSFTLSASRVNPAQSVTVSISAKSTTFSHIVKYSAGSLSGSVSVAAGASSASFAIPASWFSSFTNVSAFTATVTLETYKGSTLVGKSGGTLRVVVPDTNDFIPDFSIKLTETGSLPSGISGYVKGISRLKVELENVSLKYGASVKSVSVSLGGSTKSAVPATFSLNTNGTLEVFVRVTDSRNMVRARTQSITVYNYIPPSVSITSVSRCTSDGTVNASGTYARVKLVTNFSSVNSQNTAALTVKRRKSGETEGTTSTYAAAATLILSGFTDLAASYDIEVSITDTFTTVPFTVSRLLPGAYVPFNIRRGGRGASFGGYSERDNELKVCYDLNVLGSLVADTPPTFTAESGISEADVQLKYFKCLGLVFVSGRIVVSAGLSPDTIVRLGTFGAPRPESLTVINAAANNTLTAKVVGHVASNGVLTVFSDRNLAEGVAIYINGFWMNGGM